MTKKKCINTQSIKFLFTNEEEKIILIIDKVRTDNAEMRVIN